ncbi:MAG: molybdopterin-guanine dinucleotide biosynthesis protein B [Pseudomonadota bacterium]
MSSRGAHPPVLGFIAPSGTGKTTLIAALIPLLRAKAVRVACLKHTHHNFDIDYEGKDSYRFREAGATQVLVGSPKRWALVVERQQEDDPRIDNMIEHLFLDPVDLIIAEGFKRDRYPKIEVHREKLGTPLFCLDDDSIIAVATDNEKLVPHDNTTLLPLNQPSKIAEFILEWMKNATN